MSETVAVLHLDRFGNPPGYARRFLASLAAHPAGARFDLVWQHKEYPAGTVNPALAGWRSPELGRLIADDRLDAETYQFAAALDCARRLDHEFLVLTTSWTRILAPGWLAIFLAAFRDVADCGAVGATGSHESPSPEQGFPNVHIRTNAFMIRRELLLALDPGDLVDRDAGYRFEAGPRGMTRRLIERGLRPLVADRFGRFWTSEDWPKSRTFRSGHQEGLLIADNRTHDWDVSSWSRRRRLARITWGDAPVATFTTPFARRRARIAWERSIADRAGPG